MSANPIVRLYKVADAYIIEFAKTLRGLFITDQAAFVARDLSFASPYENTWLAAIDAAEAQPSDQGVEAELTQLTADVDAQMELCRNTFQDAKPFIKKAFPDMPGRWNQFGFADYDRVRKNQAFMIQFMDDLHAAAVRYAPELNAANFTPAMVAELETRKSALDTANDAQEQFKKMMLNATEQRVIALNTMYGFCTTVCETGKLVMRNSYAGYQRYLLPASDEAPNVMALLGRVTTMDMPPNPAVGIEGVTVTIVQLGLDTTTDSNGNYGFGPIPAGTYNLRFSKAGFMGNDVAGVVVVGPESPVTVNATLMPMP
ncbi:MAG: carboxypeptidase-like regulatory domain-containing protein [Flavobacteriales bacterium]|nr:carboxypeptidase-like regulatory domain-containing protein [Flavobacteriales bacterium]